jgi:4-amino-4-deoxy-L-arabinose transferase-like glycosyltransferase
MQPMKAKDNGSPPSFRLPVRLLILVLLVRLAFALMVWTINGPSGVVGPDTSSYVAPATSLLHGSFLSESGQPEIYRTPGYPVLLLPAVVSQHFEIISLLENLLFAGLCAWLIYKIAQDVFPGNNSAGWWAVIFYGFEFSSVFYSVKALSEALFCVQFTLFVWLLIRYLQKPAYGRLSLAALALGLATYTRPVGSYLGLFLIPVLLWLPRKLPFPQRVLRALVFPSIVALSLVPWVLRNIAVADYAGFAPVSDYILYYFGAPAVQSKIDGTSILQIQEKLGFGGLPYVKNEIYLQHHPEQRDWSQGRIVRYWDSQARGTIFAHLGSYIVIHVRGCLTTLFDPAATELLKVLRMYPEHGGLMVRSVDQGYARALVWLAQTYPAAILALVVLGVQLVVYYGLAVLGILRMPREFALVLVLLVLSFAACSGGPGALARYRAPMMPLVCISAGVAVAAWRAKTTLRSGNAAASAPGIQDRDRGELVRSPSRSS